MPAKSRIPLLAAVAVLAAACTWAAAQEPNPSAGASSAAGAQTSRELPSVEVARRVLARWGWRVCPLVSGLNRQDGEFILERVSEIARAAGVPLASEHCGADLYILVTSQPEELLKGMERRNRAFTFGYEPPPPAAVDEFITTPRPVRVWYDTYPETAWGLPVGRDFPLISGLPYFVTAPASELTLKSNVVQVIYRVFVVVDLQALKGVSLGQLADYVGMVGLAQLRPYVRLGGTSSILQLFEKTPQGAPAGMTDWDHALLKTLYGKEGSTIVRSTAIDAAGGIVH